VLINCPTFLILTVGNNLKNEMEKNSISWKRVAVFFIVATLISNIFRFDIFEFKSELVNLPSWIFIFLNLLLEGSGVIIGVLFIIPFLKKEQKTEISLFGTSKSKSLLMAVIPIILLTVIGVTNDFEMEYHIYGLVAGFGTFIYCVMEEYGWRGYLQEELKSLKPWKRYLLIGLLWFLWHLSFLKGVRSASTLSWFTIT
jgi:uncharacterized protein